jgi:hypothetical protein
MSISWNGRGGLGSENEVTHVGVVLGFETAVERIMSDVYADVRYAVVLEDGKLRRLAVGNSEFGASATATVDADIRVIEAAHDVMIQQELQTLRHEHANYVNGLVLHATTPAKGKDVVVARGKKVAKGTTGRVFWMGDNGWGMSVGIECADGSKHFTAAKNVDVVNPDDYLDIDECLKPVNADYARKQADKRLFTLTGYTVSQPMAA